MRWDALISGLGTIVLGGLCGMALFPLLVHWCYPAMFHQFIAPEDRWPHVRNYCLIIVIVFIAWFVLNNILGLV